jgi:hypothetical protein
MKGKFYPQRLRPGRYIFNQGRQERRRIGYICALVRLELKYLMIRLHKLYFEAYSREDKFVPSPNGIAPSYEKLIKESLFLLLFKERSVFPYVPRDYEVTKALTIGKVQRDQLKQSGHFNYTKESIVNGEALKWKRVTFRGWKLHKLIAEINANHHQNTYYIEFNEKLTMQSRDGINLALKHIPSIGKLRQERKVRQLRSKIHPEKSQKAPMTMKYFWIRLPNQQPTLNRLKSGNQHPRV